MSAAGHRPVTCIIGAGCSGFTMAKRLKDVGLPDDCFEMSDDIGGNWYFGNPNGASSWCRRTGGGCRHVCTSEQDRGERDHRRRRKDPSRSLPRQPRHRMQIDFNTCVTDLLREIDHGAQRMAPVASA